MDLTDLQWLEIKSLMPPMTPRHGRPPLDSRLVLNGIFWKIRNGSTWRDIPSRYPSHQSCFRFYGLWKESELLDSVITTLYSHLVYQGKLTPYRAVAEDRIFLRLMDRSFKFYLDPRYYSDWRTHTALLFLQIELQNTLSRMRTAFEEDRLRPSDLNVVVLPFSLWPRYDLFDIFDSDPEAVSAPEDIIFQVNRDGLLSMVEVPVRSYNEYNSLQNMFDQYKEMDHA